MRMQRTAIVVLLCQTACGGGAGTGADVPDVSAEAGGDGQVHLGEGWAGEAGKDGTFDRADPGAVPDMGSDCAEGGCFKSKCATNEDCDSGWCVEHMGEGVCSVTCETECPAGFTCTPVAGSGRDLTYVCVSDYANLCKPCLASADCKSLGAVDDVCIGFGELGFFCGGRCTEEEDCPEGFSCQEAAASEGVQSLQCVPDAGVCECTDKSIALSLAARCVVPGPAGDCIGLRVCGPDGLTQCDAGDPAAEVCNGVDDDCDMQVDESDVAANGAGEGICGDGNDCTLDQCQGAEGCTSTPLSDIECTDGDLCTTSDSCADGTCVGVPVDCGDGNDCTEDFCDPSAGCGHDDVPDGAECEDGDVCKDGECSCVPQCDGKECGPDGCGAECGACDAEAGMQCVDGACQCIPKCAGQQCGDDGCGGVCGVCGCGEACEAGQCAVHACDQQECGFDFEGCGVSCGNCEDGFTCVQGECLPLCSPFHYGAAGAGVGNGLTCEGVCAAMGGTSVDWTGLQEQIAYCQALHAGASVYVADPSKPGYPLWESQANICRVNKDGSKSAGYQGSGTAASGEQVLCRCEKPCACPILCYDTQVCMNSQCVDVACPGGFVPVLGGPNGVSYWMTPDCTGPEHVGVPPASGPWRLSPTPLCRATEGLFFMALSSKKSPACTQVSLLPDSVWLEVKAPTQ